MKNQKMILGIAIFVVIGFTIIACNKSGGSSSGGGKTLNSPEALKEYLDSQPANSPDKPIKVSMGANALMLPKIRVVLNSSGKYVSLNLTGNALTEIPYNAFYRDDNKHDDNRGCETLVSITIPNSVTSIGSDAFKACFNLTSVTFQGIIDKDNIEWPFHGDLEEKYLAGGIGTYTTTAPVDYSSAVWMKK